MVRFRRIRLKYRNTKTWSLLHDNAAGHTSLIVRQFLACNQVCVLNHPQYSPDLVIDFFLKIISVETEPCQSSPECNDILVNKDQFVSRHYDISREYVYCVIVIIII